MAKYYLKTHEWVTVDGDEATIGVSPYIGQKLGDITYAELPKIGSDVIVGDSLGVVESALDASDIYSPLSGTVIAVNKNLIDDPGLLSNSPDTKGWICKLENINLDELDDLLTEDEYAKYLRKM